jgi:hypothetical protein
MTNIEKGSSPENEKEKILDKLEIAFEKKRKAELMVSEPSGEMRVNTVFIVALENGILFVSESEFSPIMGIKIDDVRSVDLMGNPEDN